MAIYHISIFEKGHTIDRKPLNMSLLAGTMEQQVCVESR